jgi:hypothetical protein
MARQRNNIYAIAADTVDLALDTAGTIGSMVGGMAHMVGIGNSGPKKSEEHARQEVDDAAERVATSLRQEADAAKPRSSKPKAAVSKGRSTKSVKKVAKGRAQKVA